MGVIYDESGCGSGMGEDPAPSSHMVPVPALWAECAYCKEVGEEECLHPVSELRWNGEQWCCEECGSGEEPDAWQDAPQIAIPSPQTNLTAEQIATKACAESVRDNGILGGSAYDCALRAARIALKTPAPASNLVGDEAEWIKTCTAKISNAIGGGSELFSRHGDEFRLDIDFVCKRISELRERQNEAMRRAIHLVSWKDISTAPKDGTVVDLWVVAKGAVFQASGFRWVGGEWLSESRGASLHFHYGNEIVGPSHWILPHGAPPTEFRR